MSGGKTYGEPWPIETCPYCGSECEADWCDVGVGYVQCGPFHCTVCGASEIGPHDDERELTTVEEYCGWYGPDSEPGSSANVINGKIVDYKEMESVYYNNFTGNPLYEVEGYVESWLENIRKPKNG